MQSLDHLDRQNDHGPSGFFGAGDNRFIDALMRRRDSLSATLQIVRAEICDFRSVWN